MREGQGDTFAATVAGFEYTLYHLRNSPLDLGLLLEYLYDGRDADAPPSTPKTSPPCFQSTLRLRRYF